jgi:YD repeat-containing protein
MTARAALRPLFLLALAALASPAWADDVAYTYDVLGRLTREDYASGKSIVYSYDAAGNRTQVAYNGVNGAPAAVNDAKTINVNQTIAAFDPRSNDSDPDGDALTVTAAGPGHSGTVTINAGQTIKYVPTTHAPGTDIFPYTISDGHGDTATANITITLNNRPPTAFADAVATGFNTAKQVLPLANDSDPDGDSLSITQIVQGPSNGTALRNGTTQVTYTPNQNFTGSDTFTYKVTDGWNSSVGTVTVTVKPQNTAPVAVDDAVNTHQPSPVSFSPVQNDTDPDDDPISIDTVTSQPANGQVGIDSATTMTYAPNAGFSGTDSFTYTAKDDHGHVSNRATVTITVLPTFGGGP